MEDCPCCGEPIEEIESDFCGIIKQCSNCEYCDDGVEFI